MRRSALVLLAILGLAVPRDASAKFKFFPTPGAKPVGICAGPDGNVWFTAGDRIARITPSGDITWFDLPGITDATDIAAGPDGNLWFLMHHAVGAVSTSGALLHYLPILSPSPSLRSIVLGPDRALWFGDRGNRSIWRLTIDGVLTEFPVGPRRPYRITFGADGDLWFVDTSPSIHRMTTWGAVTTLPVYNDGLWACALGPDESVWFARSGSVGYVTPAGAVATFPTAEPKNYNAMVSGADGNLWVAGDDTFSCVTPCPLKGDLRKYERDGLLRVETSGTQTFYPFARGSVIDDGVTMVSGPDGALWLTAIEGIVRFHPVAAPELPPVSVTDAPFRR